MNIFYKSTLIQPRFMEIIKSMREPVIEKDEDWYGVRAHNKNGVCLYVMTYKYTYTYSQVHFLFDGITDE